MLIQQLHHIVQRDKHFGVIVFLEFELDFGPSLLDILEFFLDFGLLLSHVDQLIHLIFEQMQL